MPDTVTAYVADMEALESMRQEMIAAYGSMGHWPREIARYIVQEGRELTARRKALGLFTTFE